MEFVHEGCGGRVVPDITGLLGVRAPAPTIGIRGMSYGIIEIYEKSKKDKSDVVMNCMRCKNDITQDSWSEITTECTLCRREFPLTELNSSDAFSTICRECISELDRTTKSPANLKRLRSYIKLPKNFHVRPLVDVLLHVVEFAS